MSIPSNRRQRLTRLEQQVVVDPGYDKQAIWWLALGTMPAFEGPDPRIQERADLLFAAHRGDQDAIAQVRARAGTPEWFAPVPGGILPDVVA